MSFVYLVKNLLFAKIPSHNHAAAFVAFFNGNGSPAICARGKLYREERAIRQSNSLYRQGPDGFSLDRYP